MKDNLTILIQTDKGNVSGCLKSARILTSNIVVDRNVGTYVERVRQSGIEKVQTTWVLILDDDERITRELAKEIKSSISNPQFTHYKIPRRNIFGKKWLKHGDWWPDHQVRLINKKYFKNWPLQIHSTPEIEGDVGYLKNPMTHLFHGDLEQMVNKTIVFEEVESDLLFKAGRRVGTVTFFRKFAGELIRRFFKNKGFLDGAIGIIESIYQAFSKTITYLYLYEKKKSRSL
jgi:glycosyltransferase involved in cell wall biosynthesis